MARMASNVNVNSESPKASPQMTTQARIATENRSETSRRTVAFRDAKQRRSKRSRKGQSGDEGVAGRVSDRPDDWKIPPWHHRESRKLSAEPARKMIPATLELAEKVDAA